MLTIFYGLNNFFRAKHGESLTRATLTISKYGAIVAFSELLNGLPGSAMVHSFLGAHVLEDMVEGKARAIAITAVTSTPIASPSFSSTALVR